MCRQANCVFIQIQSTVLKQNKVIRFFVFFFAFLVLRFASAAAAAAAEYAGDALNKRQFLCIHYIVARVSATCASLYVFFGLSVEKFEPFHHVRVLFIFFWSLFLWIYLVSCTASSPSSKKKANVSVKSYRRLTEDRKSPRFVVVVVLYFHIIHIQFFKVYLLEMRSKWLALLYAAQYAVSQRLASVAIYTQ